jgi:molybdate transport system substrate-binding protein
MRICFFAVALWLGWGAWAHAGTVQVAVAANFSAPMKRIAAAFERDTGHRALLSFGSTGKLAAQVRHGAPFDVLLAADAATPSALIDGGWAVGASRFTYAIGQLVLYSAQAGVVDEQGAVLNRPLAGKLALADPKLAPYGAAALAVMQRLGVVEVLRPAWVMGESIGQAYQFVQTGNALMGFVALSQVMVDGRLAAGSAWRVPAQWHPPIRQDAVLLQRSADHVAAQDLMRYLQGDAARAIMRAAGYRF